MIKAWQIDIGYRFGSIFSFAFPTKFMFPILAITTQTFLTPIRRDRCHERYRKQKTQRKCLLLKTHCRLRFYTSPTFHCFDLILILSLILIWRKMRVLCLTRSETSHNYFVLKISCNENKNILLTIVRVLLLLIGTILEVMCELFLRFDC